MNMFVPERISKRHNVRLEKISDTLYGVILNSVIIQNNTYSDIHKVDFVGIDTSLRGTAISISIPLGKVHTQMDLETLMKFQNNTEIVKLIFAEYTALPEVLYETLQLNDISYLEYPPFIMNLIIKYLFKDLLVFVDALNSRLVVSFKFNLPTTYTAQSIRLRVIHDSYRFIIQNFFKLLNFVFKCSYLISSGLSLPFLSDKRNEIIIEYAQNLTIKQLRFKERVLRPIINIEDINTMTDFIGTKKNAMSFGVVVSQSARILLDISEEYAKEDKTFKGLIFLTSKSSLDAFIRNSIGDLLDAISVEVGKQIKSTKINQIKLFKLHSGFAIGDDDVADSFAYILYCMNLYKCINDIFESIKGSTLVDVSESNGYISIKPSNFWYKSKIDHEELKTTIATTYKLLVMKLEQYFLNIQTVRNSLQKNFQENNFW